MELTFDDVVKYAELKGYAHREEPSKAKDYTQTFWDYPWRPNTTIMALYEGERRTLRGKKEPEVCWICISCYGDIISVPSRHIRKMCEKRGFSFLPDVKDHIIKTLNGYDEPDILDYIKSKEAH